MEGELIRLIFVPHILVQNATMTGYINALPTPIFARGATPQRRRRVVS